MPLPSMYIFELISYIKYKFHTILYKHVHDYDKNINFNGNI